MILLSRDSDIDAPADPIFVDRQLFGFVALRTFQYGFLQPPGVSPINAQRSAECSRFVPAARVSSVEAVILDLANIEYCLFAIW